MGTHRDIPTRRPEDRAASAPAGKAALLWILSGSMAVALLRQMYGETGPAYAAFQFDLPLATRAALAAGWFLNQGLGLLVTVGVLGASALPFALGARGRAPANVYFALTVVAVLALSSSWFALHGPLEMLSQKLQMPAAAPGR